MTYLVDANVLSEPTRADPAGEVVAWLRLHERELAVDPFILGEVEFGIRRLPHGLRRERLQAWFDGGISRITCLSWDATCGSRWAALLADLRTNGRQMPIKDSLIATTALIHDLVVVTRNTRDFEATGVRLLDPFERPTGGVGIPAG